MTWYCYRSLIICFIRKVKFSCWPLVGRSSKRTGSNQISSTLSNITGIKLQWHTAVSYGRPKPHPSFLSSFPITLMKNNSPTELPLLLASMGGDFLPLGEPHAIGRKNWQPLIVWQHFTFELYWLIFIYIYSETFFLYCSDWNILNRWINLIGLSLCMEDSWMQEWTIHQKNYTIICIRYLINYTYVDDPLQSLVVISW